MLTKSRGRVSMSDPSPVIDVDAEADQLAIQAVPGAIFLRLRKEREDGSFRRMFVEMTVDQAVALREELELCIEAAVAAIA
jgi:hypothetical protein